MFEQFIVGVNYFVHVNHRAYGTQFDPALKTAGQSPTSSVTTSCATDLSRHFHGSARAQAELEACQYHRLVALYDAGRSARVAFPSLDAIPSRSCSKLGPLA